MVNPVNLDDFVRGASRLAVIGVGSGLRGDDAAGLAVVRRLRRGLRSKKTLLLECGTAPEGSIRRIREFGPSHVLVIDAADFGGEPGEIAVFTENEISGTSISTHLIPLSVLCSYIRREFGARVLFVGIQPAQLRFGSRMSWEVRAAVSELSERLKAHLTY